MTLAVGLAVGLAVVGLCLVLWTMAGETDRRPRRRIPPSEMPENSE